MPPGGPTFFTWDPLLHRQPDRAWRRWGTDTTVAAVLHILAGYRAANPDAAYQLIDFALRPEVQAAHLAPTPPQIVARHRDRRGLPAVGHPDLAAQGPEGLTAPRG